MGLDQYIYRHKNEIKTVRAELEEIRKESNKYVDQLCDNTSLEALAKEFLEQEKDRLSDKYDIKHNIDITKYKIQSIVYGNIDIEYVMWDLFNNCSVLKYTNNKKEKFRVAKNLLHISKHLLPSEEQLARSAKEEILMEQIENLTEKVMYWRKYYKLNDFMCNNYGANNCEETILNLDILYEIKDLLKKDNRTEEIEMLQSIIHSYDESKYTYVYYPCW